MTDEYQRDEFDEIAERGGPVGVHRAPRRWWTLVLWPIVIFVLAGALAFLVATFLWNSGDGGDADPSPSATVSVTPTATPSATPTAAPSETSGPEPSATETAEPVIEFDAPVAVLNGTGISGLAGSQAQILTDAGFSDVAPANLSGDAPDANVVVYADEALADTAADIASRLGIDGTALGTPQSDADVEVQLVSDPR